MSKKNIHRGGGDGNRPAGLLEPERGEEITMLGDGEGLVTEMGGGLLARTVIKQADILERMEARVLTVGEEGYKYRKMGFIPWCCFGTGDSSVNSWFPIYVNRHKNKHRCKSVQTDMYI